MNTLDPQQEFALGVAHAERHNWAAAEEIFVRLLRHQSLAPECLQQMALSSCHQGNAWRGRQFFAAAIAAAPDQARLYCNFAITLSSAIGRDAAEALCQKALRLDRQDANAANLFGILAGRRGDRDQARHWLKRSAALAPQTDSAYNNLGMDEMTFGDAYAAAAKFRRSIILNPLSHAHFANSGNLWLRASQPVQAELWYRAALIRSPGDAMTINSLGVALQERGRVEPAVTWIQRAVTVAPSYSYAAMNLIFARLYHPATGLADSRALAVQGSERHFGTIQSLPDRPDLPERPVRLGFVSADFREHAVGFLCLPALEALGKMGFEIFLYSAKPREDYLSLQFRELAAEWRSIVGLEDREAAELIRHDQVDILFDLGGYSADNRLAVFAYRPAPLQISWLGYPGTTGLAAMDYILADGGQIPPGAEAEGYSEKVIRLPHSYVAYRAHLSVPAVSELPADRNGAVTFGSFNALKKISPALLHRWVAILQSVPGSRLLIKSPPLNDPATRTEVMSPFLTAGIDPARLTLIGVTGAADHQRIMGEVDIALDSVPYTGGLTTLDTLWMGVPVVTRVGDTFCSRHSFGYLSTLGLERFAARDMDEYGAIAVALASDLGALARLRKELRPLMRASPLCDAERFAQALSSALGVAWKGRISGQPADHITVTD